MKPGEFSLVRQKGSPFWYADHLAWDGKVGGFRRKFTSTKVRAVEGNERQARKAAGVIAAAAVKVANGVLLGWSRESALALVNDLERMAGLPQTERARSWLDVSALWMAGKQGMAEKSRQKYESAVKEFSDWLGRRAKDPLESLNGVDLVQFRAALVARGFMDNTLSATMGLVRSVFEMARNEGWISKNPAALATGESDARQKVHKETFTVEEVRRLLAAARARKQHGEEWVTLILVGLCTGARLGDCVRMGPGHLDRSGEVWMLRFTPGKTARKGIRVEVPVVEPLLGRLQELMKQPKAMLFCPHLALRNASKLSRTFGDLLKDSGIVQKVTLNPVRGASYRSKTFHSLRHTLPSWMKAAGVEKETRMKILGHTNEGTHARYTHLEIDGMKTALEAGLGKLAG